MCVKPKKELGSPEVPLNGNKFFKCVISFELQTQFSYFWKIYFFLNNIKINW